MATHNDTGHWGETLACEYLAAKGYAIAEHNWRCGHYEIDIIAYKGSRIIFVEVKTRSNKEEDPLEAVNRSKIMRLVRAAKVYIEANKINHDLQFDLIAINGNHDEYHIEHIEDAFAPPLITY